MTQRTSHRLLPALILLSSLFSACANSARETEALYLLEALHQVEGLPNHALPQSHPLFVELDVAPDGTYEEVPSGHHYAWFTMSSKPVQVMSSRSVTLDDARPSFHGFFVVYNQQRQIVDFGWHKP